MIQDDGQIVKTRLIGLGL